MRRVRTDGIQLAAVMALAIALGCRDGGSDQDAIRTLRAEIERASRARDTVDVTAAAPFAWDALFVFPPYTTPGQIASTLGFPWPDAARSAIGTQDGYSLLLFVKGGRVAHWADFPREFGDFSGVRAPHGIRRGVRFRVASSEGRPVLSLSAPQ
jgi:hypothetical protein